jgi:hypothetical protein
VRRPSRLTCFLTASVLIAGVLTGACGSRQKQVEDAILAGRSWAATAKVVTEEWAQARVSLRFTRTTLTTAGEELSQSAESIRAIDATAASRLDRLKDAIDPVMRAVAANKPDQARDLGARLTTILPPQPIDPASGAPR